MAESKYGLIISLDYLMVLNMAQPFSSLKQ